MKTRILLPLVVFGLVVPVAAQAHAQLVKALPPVGGSVTAPTEIRITFSEKIEPRLSKIELAAGDGRPVETGAAGTDAADPAVLTAPVKAKLAPGRYKVTWHVVSVDTHRTQGSFTFEVKP